MIDDIRQRSWDWSLMVLTVALLGSLGVQSFLGTAWAWYAQTQIPGWEQLRYPAFVETMNLIAAPQLVALVVVMGLCIPKRLFARRALIGVSAGMVALGIAAYAITGSLVQGLAAYLALAALIQVAVVIMTAAGAKGPSYMTEGRITKLGSGLLHLGFILFTMVMAAFQRSELMLPLFWTSTVLMMVGTLMSFYAERLAWRRPARAERETSY
jgi:hypothetical protein